MLAECSHPALLLRLVIKDRQERNLPAWWSFVPFRAVFCPNSYLKPRSWNIHPAADIQECEQHSPASANDSKPHSETHHLPHCWQGHISSLEPDLRSCSQQITLRVLPPLPLPWKVTYRQLCKCHGGMLWMARCEEVLKHFQRQWPSLVAGGRTHLY